MFTFKLSCLLIDLKAERIGRSSSEFKISSSKRSNLYNDSLKYEENPFISEDFQPTPVVKYLKNANIDSRGRSKKEEKLSDLFPLPQTPAFVRQKTFLSEGHVAHADKDFYQNFSENVFFETPSKHAETKQRKPDIEESCGLRQSCIPKRALFDESSISSQCFVRQEEKQNARGGLFRSINGSGRYAYNSISSSTASHSGTKGVYISIPKAIPDGSEIEALDDTNSSKRKLSDRLLYKKTEPCSLSDDIHEFAYSACKSDKTKLDQFHSGLCTPKNPNTTSSKRKIISRKTSTYTDFCESLDNSFEVRKQNYVRDDMSPLVTSTPMGISRNHMELVISPIPPSKKPCCVNLNELHINHSVTEEVFPKADNQILPDTMSLNKTVDIETHCMDLRY
jgi:hypothetical protein